MRGKQIFLLVFIIGIAAWFRLSGINWDTHAHLHPDERFLTMVTTNIRFPTSIARYFDTRLSPMNPHNSGFSFYVYGTYPVHLTKLLATLLSKDTYEDIPAVGRALSAIVDLCILLVVYTLAARLGKRPEAGLLAACCYAVAVLPVQLSHFYTVDPFATLFITLALWHIIRKKIGITLGIVTGLAIAAKISSVLIIPVVGIAVLADFPWKKSDRTRTHIWAWLTRVLLTGIAGAVTVRLMYPYLFVGWRINELVVSNWKELTSFDGPQTMFPPALQWIGVPWWQMSADMLIWGMGLPFGIISILSLFFFLRSAWKNHRPDPAWYLILWILLLVSYQSIQFAKPMRYLYPIYPSLAVLAGIFLARVRLSFLPALFALLVLLMWPLAFTAIYRAPNTRVAASAWIYDTIPAGTTIAWETWDDPLPFALGGNSIDQYHTIQLPMYDPDTGDKWPKLVRSLSQTDYIILSSNRVYGGTLQAHTRFPLTARYYRLLFSGALGFEKTEEFVSRPHIPAPFIHICLRPPGFSYGDILSATLPCPSYGLTVIDDFAEESFTVYDHPKVTIFKNTLHYTPEQLYAMITNL